MNHRKLVLPLKNVEPTDLSTRHCTCIRGLEFDPVWSFLWFTWM